MRRVKRRRKLKRIEAYKERKELEKEKEEKKGFNLLVYVAIVMYLTMFGAVVLDFLEFLPN